MVYVALNAFLNHSWRKTKARQPLVLEAPLPAITSFFHPLRHTPPLLLCLIYSHSSCPHLQGEYGGMEQGGEGGEVRKPEFHWA